MDRDSSDWSEGLDAVPWATLSHAYGAADDVPGILRDCASPDADTADEAVSELFGNIWHQGTVYEATAHAVPFLVKLVQRPETHQRFMLLALLESIANGSRYYSLKAEDPEVIAAGERDVAHAHAAVERHVQDFIALAADSDAGVRRQVPCVMARLEGGRTWLAEHAIARAASEPDVCAAAHWLLALTYASPGPAAAAELQRATLSQDVAVRVAAATLMLFCGPPAEWHAAAETMTLPFQEDATRAMALPLQQENAFVKLYSGGFLGLSGREEHTSAVLERLPMSQRLILISHLCRYMPSLDDISSSMVAETCLSLIFDPKALPSSVAELTDEQRVVLTELDRAKNVHHGGDDLVILHTLQQNGVLAELGIASRAHW